MNHLESSIKVYYSKEYSLFRMILGNRQLNQAKIKRIENDIMDGLDVLRYCPILVKENHGLLEIVDGQHRYWVAKKMKSKVWYIVVEDFSVQDIAKINSNTEKWKNEDYINCYIALENENYSQLRSFIETTEFPLSLSIRLLSTGKTRGGSGADDSLTQSFKKGLFNVKHYNESLQLAQVCRRFECFSGWNTGNFIAAVETIKIGGKCDIAELTEMFNNQCKAFAKKTSPKEYLTQLEEVYNYRMRQRRVIY